MRADSSDLITHTVRPALASSPGALILVPVEQGKYSGSLAAMVHRQVLIRNLQGNLPVGLDVWLKARRGYRLPPARRLDLGKLNRLATASTSELLDPMSLASVIEYCGLSDDRPSYFPGRYSESLGTGLLMWQSPPQLAAYLCEVAKYDVHTYLEVGSQHGGTFLFTAAYLDRISGLRHADAVDLTLPTWRHVSIGDASVVAHRMNSLSRRFRRLVKSLAPIDLALIDGDHTALGCMRDFRAVEPFARLIAFHDISDRRNWEVHLVWDELRRTHANEWEFHSFTDQDSAVVDAVGHELFGIGLMIRKGAQSTSP